MFTVNMTEQGRGAAASAFCVQDLLPRGEDAEEKSAEGDEPCTVALLAVARNQHRDNIFLRDQALWHGAGPSTLADVDTAPTTQRSEFSLLFSRLDEAEFPALHIPLTGDGHARHDTPPDNMQLPTTPTASSAEAAGCAASSTSGDGEIRVQLHNKDLWDKFHKVGTEMIITKAGR